MLKFNGKPFNSDEFERAMLKKTAESVIAQVREKYGSIRHPETGEFPTVYAAGSATLFPSMRWLVCCIDRLNPRLI